MERTEFDCVIDADCARQLVVTSEAAEFRGEPNILVRARCLSCKGSEVVTWAAQIGDAEHLAQATRNFCKPGEYDPTLQTANPVTQ